ncbi:hypothetical protein DFH09DRAFT_1071167 [Mycena vulgaris]|nr:hypothetical protein DFH09DRAFT_1071167 [Mycena vulgaris]
MVSAVKIERRGRTAYRYKTQRVESSPQTPGSGELTRQRWQLDEGFQQQEEAEQILVPRCARVRRDACERRPTRAVPEPPVVHRQDVRVQAGGQPAVYEGARGALLRTGRSLRSIQRQGWWAAAIILPPNAPIINSKTPICSAQDTTRWAVGRVEAVVFELYAPVRILQHGAARGGPSTEWRARGEKWRPRVVWVQIHLGRPVIGREGWRISRIQRWAIVTGHADEEWRRHAPFNSLSPFNLVWPPENGHHGRLGEDKNQGIHNLEAQLTPLYGCSRSEAVISGLIAEIARSEIDSPSPIRSGSLLGKSVHYSAPEPRPTAPHRIEHSDACTDPGDPWRIHKSTFFRRNFQEMNSPRVLDSRTWGITSDTNNASSSPHMNKLKFNLLPGFLLFPRQIPVFRTRKTNIWYQPSGRRHGTSGMNKASLSFALCARRSKYTLAFRALLNESIPCILGDALPVDQLAEIAGFPTLHRSAAEIEREGSGMRDGPATAFPAAAGTRGGAVWT